MKDRGYVLTSGEEGMADRDFVEPISQKNTTATMKSSLFNH
jgi:hypothetical protein